MKTYIGERRPVTEADRAHLAGFIGRFYEALAPGVEVLVLRVKVP